MSTDPSNQVEAEKLFTYALQIDPSNETVLTMFAMFKCNRYFLYYSPNVFCFI